MTTVKGFASEISNALGIVSFDNQFTFDDAIAVVNNPKVRRLQTKRSVDKDVWTMINEVILAKRQDIKLRIYGHYSDRCDLSFLSSLPNVRKLSVDTIMESKNADCLSELPHLCSLRLGIHDLQSFNFLAGLGKSIYSLTLERTKSKKPDLEFLDQFDGLESLRICGHAKNIEVLANLNNLKRLSLQGITHNSFNFLQPLQNLLSLNIDLVKSNDFHSLRDLPIKSFGMSEIRNMDDISFISGFQSLQELHLSDLNRITHFPQLTSKNTVRRIFIDNMKSLKSIEHVFECKNLEDFIFRAETTPLLPKNFEALTKLSKLRYSTIGTGSVRKNLQIDELLESKEISRYEHYDFEYE